MILCHANIIYVEHEPIVTATQFSSEDARLLLLSIQSVTGDGRWQRAALGGTRFRHDITGVAVVGLYARIHASAGVSMNVAPLAGLGFWHEWATMGSELVGSAKQDAVDERHCVEEIAKQRNARGGSRVVATTDLIGEGKEEFAASFRRRIAYSLGFVASLRAGTLACYEAWYERAVIGAAVHLGNIGESCDQFERFSIVLNVLARLHGTMAYELDHDTPESHAPGRVMEYREKVVALEGILAGAVRGLRQRMNADGRIALRAVLSQLRSERSTGIYNVRESPVWGLHVDSREFL